MQKKLMDCRGVCKQTILQYYKQNEIAMVIGEALEEGDGTLLKENLENAIMNHDETGRDSFELSPEQVEYLENIQQLLLAGEV